MPRTADIETALESHPSESTVVAPLADALREPPAAPPQEVEGKLLAGRFRLLSTLGSGGMGRVFRARDLALSQDVALKLLPASLSHDSFALGLLREEVKLARRVSHPNVCRVHDLGETAEGELFLTMELVEGETLAAVLRRVGRLAGERAQEMAGQIAAGLAAAHAEGIVHRDLKPANVLLDADGRPRIADFGVATAADRPRAGEIAGTPAYMAPEQLAGLGATPKSDVFSLGLVLYELFTGRRAIDAPTHEELQRQHASGVQVTPSQVARELDPRVERVILRCLEREPARRPTALEVLTELSGGDALRAAREAGQTPSPTAVAGSGPAGTLRPRVALGLLLAFSLAVLSGFVLQRSGGRLRMEFLDVVPLPHPPQVLEFRAHETLAALGLAVPPGRRDSGFVYDPRVLAWLAEGGHRQLAETALASGRAPAIRFAFVKGLARLPERPLRAGPDPEERQPMVPGAVSLRLDASGRLVRLTAGPDPDAPPAGSIDQVAPKLLELAGLEPGLMRPIAPAGAPPVFGDARLAFEGRAAETPGLNLRAELVTFHGRPVFFEVSGPWGASRPSDEAGSPADLLAVFETLVLIVGGFFAFRNIAEKRADLTGATRIFAFVFVLDLVVSLLRNAHGVSAPELRLVMALLSASLFGALADGVFYLALEPHVRKLWPESLVSWSRLVSGRFRDPMVARDILLGLFLYEAIALATLAILVPFRESAAQFPARVGLTALNGPRYYLAALLDAPRNGVDLALFYLLLLILVRVMVKRMRVAGLLFFAVLTALLAGAFSLVSTAPPPALIGMSAVVAGAFTVMLTRLGLLTMAVVGTVLHLAMGVPISFDVSAWFAPISLTTIGLVLGFAFYGFWFSRDPVRA